MTDQEWIEKLRGALNIPEIRSTDEPDAVVKALQTEVSKLQAEDSERDQQQVIRLRDAFGLKDVRSSDALDSVIEKAKEEVTDLRGQVETQRDEIADLTKSAEDGKTYREARVEEAIKQGNRAYGEDFDEEYHREYYGDMPLEKLEDSTLPRTRKKGMRHYRQADRRQMTTNRPQSERSGPRVNGNRDGGRK